MNKNKLLSIIVLNGDTCEQLASEMGMSSTTFSIKLNEKNGRSFNQPEIAFIKRKYKLSPQDIDNIFFREEVS